MTAQSAPQSPHSGAETVRPKRPPERPTAEDWEQAVSNIFAHYPPDRFPPDSDSSDAKAGTWARKVCLNIITEAWRVNTDRLEHERDRREELREEVVADERVEIPRHIIECLIAMADDDYLSAEVALRELRRSLSAELANHDGQEVAPNG